MGRVYSRICQAVDGWTRFRISQVATWNENGASTRRDALLWRKTRANKRNAIPFDGSRCPTKTNNHSSFIILINIITQQKRVKDETDAIHNTNRKHSNKNNDNEIYGCRTRYSLGESFCGGQSRSYQQQQERKRLSSGPVVIHLWTCPATPWMATERDSWWFYW